MAIRQDQDSTTADLIASIAGRVPSRNLHSLVLWQLGVAIVRGDFAEGTILPSDTELLARFSVSRTVLREAMKTLAAKGLVVPRARVGTKVTTASHWNLFDSDVLSWHFDVGVDKAFLLHLYDIRLAFEPFAAGWAAERATAEDIERLLRLAEEMSDPAHTSQSLAAADLKFHLAIAECSKNPFMGTVGHLIEAALAGVFRLSSPSANEQEFADVYPSHRRIVDAIAGRDPAAARAAMENVIVIGRGKIMPLLPSAPARIPSYTDY